MLPRLVSCLGMTVAIAVTGCCHDSLFCGDSGCLTDHLTCQAGCGEVYVDEWLSDPPKGCDPCDNCGNFQGHGRCDHHLVGLLHKLWGYRYEPSGCGPAASYHGYASAVHGGPAADFTIEDEGSYAMAQAPPIRTPLGSPSASTRSMGVPSMGSDFYEVGPGESVVPGSVRITEGGIVGEPTPAPAPSATPSPMPHELPGPSAAKPRVKPRTGPNHSRPVMHRQTGYETHSSQSPRKRPRTSLAP